MTGAYAVVFGGLMLAFGAIADRFGRRRIMLIGLVLLGAASLATAFVTTAEQLIAVRAAMGVAAAMTTPGSMALAFRLFDADSLRVRAITLISTVGLVGLAIGPTVGGLVLAVAPWQVLLLVNVPIAVLAIIGVRVGIAADDARRSPPRPGRCRRRGAGHGDDRARARRADPVRQRGRGLVGALGGDRRGRRRGDPLRPPRASARHPLLDLKLVARPLVSSGLAFKAAAGLATAGLGYLVTLQLQLDWGWPPALAAIGMLPQVVVLIAGGAFVNPFVKRVGLERAAWISAAAVVVGLAVYACSAASATCGSRSRSLLVAAGMRVVGVVAGINVLRGLPKNRTTIGAALIDTATEVASGVGIAVTGTILAALFTGDIATSNWSAQQTAEFQQAVTIAGLTLTVVAAALVGWGMVRARRVASGRGPSSSVSCAGRTVVGRGGGSRPGLTPVAGRRRGPATMSTRTPPGRGRRMATARWRAHVRPYGR